MTKRNASLDIYYQNTRGLHTKSSEFFRNVVCSKVSCIFIGEIGCVVISRLPTIFLLTIKFLDMTEISLELSKGATVYSLLLIVQYNACGVLTSRRRRNQFGSRWASRGARNCSSVHSIYPRMFHLLSLINTHIY